MIISRYLNFEILKLSLAILFGLFLLFSFFDFLNFFLSKKNNVNFLESISYLFLRMPQLFYELSTTAFLLGAFIAQMNLSMNNEYQIARTYGYGLKKIIISRIKFGFIISISIFIVGEFLAPKFELESQKIKYKNLFGEIMASRFDSGLWVKDQNSFINVYTLNEKDNLLKIKIFEFDNDSQLRNITSAKEAIYYGNNIWQLSEVNQTLFHSNNIEIKTYPTLRWRSVLNPQLLSIFVVIPEKMSSRDLYKYVEYLDSNNQDTKRFKIAFWQKITYPFTLIFLIIFPLFFSISNKRTMANSNKFFWGIFIGIGFNLFNKLFGHLGLILNWNALITSFLPIILLTFIFLIISKITKV